MPVRGRKPVGDRCVVCRRGRIIPHGYAWDGRPEYACSNCGRRHTYGHDGYDWDTRERNVVYEDCVCSSCAKGRADGKKEYPRRPDGLGSIDGEQEDREK